MGGGRTRVHSRPNTTHTFGVLLVAVALAFALAGVLSMSPRPAGAAGRSLTVSPADGLVDQVVRVQWSGFDPTTPDGGLTVTIYQCKGLAPTSVTTDCYTDLRPPIGDPVGTGVGDGMTTPQGTGTAFVEVRPALDLPALNCTFTTPCSMVAFENDGTPIPDHGLPATAVVAPLHFAPSPSDCPQVSTPDVTTLGENSASAALYSWSAQVCTGSKPLALDYTARGSWEGRTNFLVGNDDVGITSTPATPQEAASAKRKYTYAPIDITGVVIAFNVTDAATGQRITDMKLTPRLVAELVAGGQIGGPGRNLFADPEFLALNPNHTWPVNSDQPLLRAERNADAYVLTSWLQQDASARAYLDGKDPNAAVDPFWKGIAYPSDIFESRDPDIQDQYLPRTGTLTNVRRLFNLLPPSDAVTVSQYTDGILGVMDAVTARQFGMPTAQLLPANAAAGTPFFAADTLGLAGGLDTMKTNPDGVTRFPDVTAHSGYPLTKIDYAMVPTSGVTTAKAAKIGQFLDYVAGAGQQAGALPTGYLPLSPALTAQVTSARNAVVSQTGNPPASFTGPPPAGLLDQGQASLDGSSLGGDTGGASGSGSDATAPSPVSSGTVTPPAALASASRRRGGGGNIVVGAIRDFLGGDHQLILPAVLAAGAVALAAGPVITMRAGGKRKRRRRRRTRAAASHPSSS